MASSAMEAAVASSAGQKRPASFGDLTKNLSLMPSSEKPGYNSLRVQKAYRINGIESGRLDKQIQILERQKVHTVRLVNNDIRLTRITLDHIEASSGRIEDIQGFLSADVSESVSNFGEEESGDKPMFLYGERKVSRRSGKFRRIQSAVVKGKSTSSSGALPLAEITERPKSSIPTFREIKARVLRQMELNPDWDPNVEPPYEEDEPKPDDTRQKIMNAWSSEERLTSAATSAKTERNKSGKKSGVSWQLSRTPPDGASVAELAEDDAITIIEEENSPPQTRSAGSEKTTRKKVSKPTRRSKSASVLKPIPSSKASKLESAIDDNKTENKEPTEQDRKLVKSAKARLERTPVVPKPRNPRDHPMVKVVGKTRALIGKAKKAQCSTAYVDPEKSQLGTIIEKQIKKKAAKLTKRRDEQVLENITTDNKLAEYLRSNPAVKQSEDIDDAIVNYGLVRNVLLEKNIPLTSTLKRFEDELEDVL